MDLKQLRYFSTVAQFQNISKASQILHVSQSSLSKQIAKLEAETGVQLFDRNGKNIRLNAAGMRFNEYCMRVLRENQAVEDDIKFMSQNEGAIIRIGACCMPDSFLKCISEFQQSHPNTKYVVTSQIEEAERFDINEYDVLIFPDEYRFRKLNGYPFYTERYLFAISRENPEASAPTFSLESLKGKTIVFLQPQQKLTDYTFRVCSALSIDAAVLLFADTRDVHRRMIASNMAVGFVPKSEAESYQMDPSICLLPILNARFQRPMKICFLREKHLSSHGRLFKDFVTDYYSLQEKEDHNVFSENAEGSI